ncbi:hypothetical protein LZ016_11295 [Sphingomonas sp. SM33]|uniref:Transposase n=1 Tax=Sphingomonas telluris TaxID=2907998 RepID=A0ABS9VNX2_9SPHN|nr:hypothetical protein [Sphingomonas telluris]MCH8616681.1 hypothetical protein [Sphingomonas telluris]
MRLSKRDTEEALLSDSALAQRLETIVGRTLVEKAIHERRQPIPSGRD